MLRLAVQRQHERVLCQDTPGTNGVRFCVGPLKKVLGPRGRKLTPHQKYMALSVFCKGIWTRTRAQAAGYDADGKCPLCGLPDSVRHRVWKCLHPEAVSARKSVTDDVPVEWLAEALDSEDRLFFDEMKWEHPEVNYPPPAAAPNPILYNSQGGIVE